MLAEARDTRASDNAAAILPAWRDEIRMARTIGRANHPASLAHYDRAAFLEAVARLSAKWGARVTIGGAR